MKTIRTLTLSFFFLAAFNLHSQTQEINRGLQFNLRLQSDNQTWGVYVKPEANVAPSSSTMTGSGQVTLVTPVGFTYSKFRNHSGTWVENARVDSPVEATTNSYVSFGFIVDEPRIVLFPNEETLLFTFVCSSKFKGQVSLFNNETDPFATPNSYNTNPGNDLGMVELHGAGELQYYSYSSNYTETQSKWNTTNLASRLED